MRTAKNSHYSLNQFSVLFGEHKEDLFKAIDYARSIFLFGTRIASQPIYSHHLSTDAGNPSSFDFELTVQEKTYSVGFEIDTKAHEIVEQWVIQLHKGKKEILYYWNQQTGNCIYSEEMFKEEEFHSIVAERETRMLIVSDIITLKYHLKANPLRDKILDSIFQWFSTLSIQGPPSTSIPNRSLFSQFTLTRDETEYIVGHEIHEVEDDQVLRLNDVTNAITKENILVNLEGHLYILFHNLNKKVWYEVFSTESNEEFIYFVYVLLTMREKEPLFINLDALRYPSLLTKPLVDIYFRLLRWKDLQLIIGTEESSMLSLAVLKKSEMWFISQDQSGSSRLISYDCFFFEDDKNIALAYTSGEFLDV